MREGLGRYGPWFVVLATALLVGVPVLAGFSSTDASGCRGAASICAQLPKRP